MNAVFRRFSWAAARDVFLLRDAERTVRTYPEGARAELRALVRAAREREAAAEQAFDSHPAGALTLYREAALLAMAAAVTARGGEPPSSLQAEEVLARFGTLEVGRAPCSDAEVESFLDFVRDGDPMAAARLPALAVVERAHAARALVGWLRKLVEARSLGELRRDRALRVGAAAGAAVVFLVWTVNSLFAIENVALHKPVTTSGVHPGAASAPSGLTDGVIAGAPYGVHTAVSDAPWVQVDLGGVRKISKVKIYNRADGWLDDGLPMTLQLSETGATFVDVETRRTTFSQKAPWIAKTGNRRARYIRVRSTAGKYVTLSELEALGR